MKQGGGLLTLLEKNICPRDIITADAIHNALTVDVALGGSTNSVLHLMAIAHEAGIDFPLTLVNEISSENSHSVQDTPGRTAPYRRPGPCRRHSCGNA